MRSAKAKKLIIEELKKKPVVEAACQKVGVGRTAFYDWKKNDPKFAEAVRLAIVFGKAFMADISELQLFNFIKEGDFRAVALYLKTHHPDYRSKVEVEGAITTLLELSPEDKELRAKAIRMGRFAGVKSSGNRV